MSLRARSTSITCSARSFGFSPSSAGESAIVLLAPPAVAGPGDGSDDHPSVEHLHHRLGRRADERRLGVAHDVHVRRRVHLAEHAIHVERVERALEVEPLREDDLERVAGEDVLARDLDGVAVEVATTSTTAPRAGRTPRRRAVVTERRAADARARRRARRAARLLGRTRRRPDRRRRHRRRGRRSRPGRGAGGSGRRR